MGIWGVGALDSDDALDIVAIWEDYVHPNLVNWNSSDIHDFFNKVYFHGHAPRNSERSALVLLAVAELHFKNEIPLSESFKSELEYAVSYCLKRECINEWKEPDERKIYLEKLADRYSLSLSLEVDSYESEEKSEFELEILKLKKWFEEIDDFVEVRDSNRVSVIDKMNEMYPLLGEQLDKLYRPETDHQYTVENELYKYRQMFIAWWFGHILRFETDDAKKLIEYAENNYSPSHKRL